MLSITGLGGCGEVGKSAFLINSDSTNILLDYGVKIQQETIEYPPIPKRVDAIIPSHSHLDHSGAIPVLSKARIPIYLTDASLELTVLLLKDSVKISERNGQPINFSKKDIYYILKNARTVKYEKDFFINDVRCRLFDAGHIPGSAGILLSAKNKNIFYTGDMKLEPQYLVNGCSLPREKIDVLITESTYSDRNHPDRKKEEKNFKERIDEALNMNETVLIPSFAVGRAQEILLILKDYRKYIALDGMAQEATKIILRHKKYLKNGPELEEIFMSAKKVKNNKQRDMLLKKPHIIVTTAGMLSGGPAVYYIKKIYNRKNSRILLVGFQVEETPGKILLDTGVFRNNDTKLQVRCKVEKFDFSSHAGKNELFKIIETLKPKQVICVHGDKCGKFAKDIEKEFKIPAIAPKNGDKILVR